MKKTKSIWDKRQKGQISKDGHFIPDGEYAVTKGNRINEAVAKALKEGKQRERKVRVCRALTRVTNREEIDIIVKETTKKPYKHLLPRF